MNGNFASNRSGKVILFELTLINILILAALVPAMGAFGTSAPSSGSRDFRATADHLVLSEVCVSPTAGEFIEIHNPTDDPIQLENYYLADIPDYYNIVNSNPGFDSQHSTDFAASFPPGSSIGSGGYKVMAFNSSEFKGQYNDLVPNFCLEGGDAPFMNETAGFIGGSAGLTNSHETVILFHWDGISDLVEDVDIIWWGDDDAYKVDKSGVSIDSESDGDGDTSSYNNDASTYPKIKNVAHVDGKSFARTNLTAEPDETDNGGNGITGHDETTENLTSSWSSDLAADPVTVTPERGMPVIRSVDQTPPGNPRPETNVTITANVTDDGTVAHVNITVEIDGGAPDTHGMTHGDGDDYTYIIAYANPPMDLGTSVRYNVTATDDEGNVTMSDNFTYTYLNLTEPVFLITEVMFDDKGTDDDWVELYCLDDGNSSGGCYITGWAVDDMDTDYNKEFGNVTIHTGNVVWIHYNDGISTDETDASDGNDDGVIDLYADVSNTRMKMDGDQVALYDNEGNIIDAVCWAFNDTFQYSSEADDMAKLFADGQWNSAENTSCVDSEDVPEGWSISRSKGEADTDSKADWHALETPTPGSFGGAGPEISDVVLDPTPEADTVLPMTNVTVTARITTANDVLSANITWTLNGTAQDNIPLADDGTGPDANGTDDNWTAVLPGQPDGSVVVFSVEAFDILLERKVSASITITFSEAPKMLTLLLTEVMFVPESGENWVEIYCQEDASNGTGHDLSGWLLDDLDGSEEHVFTGTVVKTGEYILVHFNDQSASENDSTDGNNDGIIDIYTTATSGALSAGGDQLVLFNDAEDAVDAVAWQKDGTLSAHEQNDMADLLSWQMWSSNATDSCLDVTAISGGSSLSRMFDPLEDAYTDGGIKTDWFINSEPTPGSALPPPEPFTFNFTVLRDEAEDAIPDGQFTVKWSVSGEEALMPSVDLPLSYLKGSLNATAVLIEDLTATDEEYLWDLTGLEEGDYYLKVTVDDGINAPYPVYSAYPLTIAKPPVPEVGSTVPYDGSGNVDVHTEIKVTFNTDLNLSSVKPGDTFSVSLDTDGEIKIESGKTAVFTPDDLLEYEMLYTVTVKDMTSADGVEMENSYKFSFTTEKQPLYELSGKVIPSNATVLIDGEEVEVKNGEFSIMKPNGTYAIKATVSGYDPFEKTVTIAGKDKTDFDIELDETPPEENEIRIGPFVFKGTTEVIEDVYVEFFIGELKYDSKTGSDGYARLLIPIKEIPPGTKITAIYEGAKVNWDWGSDSARYDEFEKKDGGNGNGGTDDMGGNTFLWVALIIIVILIIGVVGGIFFVLFRSKKGDDGKEGEKMSWDGEDEVGRIGADAVSEDGTETGPDGEGDDAVAPEVPERKGPRIVGEVKEESLVPVEEGGANVSLAPVADNGTAGADEQLENIFSHEAEGGDTSADGLPEGSNDADDDLLDDD